MDDHNLTQMVTQPIRDENILDLFFTNNPTLYKYYKLYKYFLEYLITTWSIL